MANTLFSQCTKASEDEDRVKIYQQYLIDEDWEQYKNWPTEYQLRWILCRNRIDWQKFFNKASCFNLLANYAASDPSTRPAAFFRPEWLNIWVHEYNTDCPIGVYQLDIEFGEAVRGSDFEKSKNIFETIENLT